MKKFKGLSRFFELFRNLFRKKTGIAGCVSVSQNELEVDKKVKGPKASIIDLNAVVPLEKLDNSAAADKIRVKPPRKIGIPKRHMVSDDQPGHPSSPCPSNYSSSCDSSVNELDRSATNNLDVLAKLPEGRINGKVNDNIDAETSRGGKPSASTENDTIPSSTSEPDQSSNKSETDDENNNHDDVEEDDDDGERDAGGGADDSGINNQVNLTKKALNISTSLSQSSKSLESRERLSEKNQVEETIEKSESVTSTNQVDGKIKKSESVTSTNQVDENIKKSESVTSTNQVEGKIKKSESVTSTNQVEGKMKKSESVTSTNESEGNTSDRAQNLSSGTGSVHSATHSMTDSDDIFLHHDPVKGECLSENKLSISSFKDKSESREKLSSQKNDDTIVTSPPVFHKAPVPAPRLEKMQSAGKSLKSSKTLATSTSSESKEIISPKNSNFKNSLSSHDSVGENKSQSTVSYSGENMVNSVKPSSLLKFISTESTRDEVFTVGAKTPEILAQTSAEEPKAGEPLETETHANVGIGKFCLKPADKSALKFQNLKLPSQASEDSVHEGKGDMEVKIESLEHQKSLDTKHNKVKLPIPNKKHEVVSSKEDICKSEGDRMVKKSVSKTESETSLMEKPEKAATKQKVPPPVPSKPKPTKNQ